MTRKFYTLADLQNTVKPGSFVYPYFANKYDTPFLSNEWGTSDLKLTREELLPYITSCRALVDLVVQTALGKVTQAIVQTERTKTRYLNEKQFVNELIVSNLTWADSHPVKYPQPIGMYLGEVIQLQDENGENLKKFHTKLLSLHGTIIWV